MSTTQISTMLGQELGAYRILQQLEQGGMDEVYLAEDTVHKRHVVLKVLPSAVRRDTDRVRRIRTDVEAATRLNHPNIVRIYSFEQAQSSSGVSLQFITMEFVEGRLLSQLISSERIPPSRALVLFMPLVDALYEAHRRKMTHGDIKPDNIIITPEDVPRIMDFGLARITRPDLDVRDSRSHTRSVDILRTLMQSGAMLEAIAYMSPEQAEGRATNDRTDIFSFGTVLYEAVTGVRPFQGESYVDLVSSIMRDDPQWVNALQPEVPYSLSRVIDTCLQKDLRTRYHSMDKVRGDLEEVRREIEPRKVVEEHLATKTRPAPLDDEVKPAPIVQTKTFKIKSIAPAGAMFLVGLLVAWLVWTLWLAPPVSQTRKLPIAMGGAGTMSNTGIRTDRDDVPSISPDGTRLVYREENRLWIRDLSGMDPVALQGTEGGGRVFWAPTSKAIGYFLLNDTTRAWNIRTVDIFDQTGTLACTLPSGAIPRGAVWRQSGDIIFSMAGGERQGGVLYSVDAEGGQPVVFLTPDTTRGETGLLYPSAMPDGQTLLFATTSENSVGRLVILSGNRRTEIISHPDEILAFPVYALPGYIIYQRGLAENHALWAFPFDGSTRRGDPFLVAEYGRFPSASTKGMLMYGVETPGTEDQLVWVNRQGNITGVLGAPQERIDNPALSPDGRRVAVTGMEQGNTDIWIHEGFLGQKTRLTLDAGYDYFPVWSPDGTQIAFSSVRNISADVFMASVHEVGSATPYVASPQSEWVADWSRDGRYLSYEVDDPETKRDIWYIPMKGTRTPTPFLQTPAQELYPYLSPDGQSVVYQSDESGKPEIYARRFPSGAGKVRISANGGTAPRWSRRGDELFYIEGRKLMAVSINRGTGIKPGNPYILFDADEAGVRLLGEYREPAYDVSEDGQRFVTVQRRRTASVILVENWHQEFRAP